MRILPKSVTIAAGLAAAALFAMQLIQPVRTKPRSDPQLSFEAAAHPSPEVALSLRRACGDCHSNQTKWPWYSYVSPVSWFIVQDVRDGRAHLNFSEWNRPREEEEVPEPGELCEALKDGKMPPRSYALLHSADRLTQSEVAAICALAVAAR